LCRKLNHPQETYGYRVEYHGKVVTFCTDHEPYAALHQPLVELAKGADLFITDCQYTYHEYAGAKGVPKLGWGHSFPEYIAQVAQTAKCKQIATTHHDPGAHDAHVTHIAQSVEQLSGTPACAAYEGLVLNV
jgi:ribonuclease BN (tRNA processing enzyme)